jgi:hypothetical protein
MGSGQEPGPGHGCGGRGFRGGAAGARPPHPDAGGADPPRPDDPRPGGGNILRSVLRSHVQDAATGEAGRHITARIC